MRGSAFVFRKYDSDEKDRTWSLLFAIGSAVSPIMLGICVGAVSNGAIRVDPSGRLISGYLDSWWRPFPLVAGLFTLCLFTFLAAVYMCGRSGGQLREDFRRRALAAAVAVAVLALAAYLVARADAPRIATALTSHWWSLPLQALTAICALATLWLLWRRHFAAARAGAAAQTGLIVLGWAFGQFPYLIYPDLAISASAAPTNILKMTVLVLGCGSLLLVPSFVYLFKVFSFSQREHGE